MQTCKPKKLILGIGNILLQDEGIGVRLIEYLRKQTLPADVELVDGGTAGADLIDVLSDRQHVIIIDAVNLDAPPGTLVELKEEDLLDNHKDSVSLHDLDIPATLAMTRVLGCAPKQTVFFGIVPFSIEPGLELTECMQKLVPSIAQKIIAAI